MRRSFLFTMGAALSAALAAGLPGTAQPNRNEHEDLKTQADRLSRQLATIEDAAAIHQLHQSYGSYLDKGMHEEIVKLFAEDAQVSFNGGIFIGRDKGIRRLYVHRFGQWMTARLDGPVHVTLLDRGREKPAVEVAPDGESAQARFHCLMQVSAWDTSRYPMMDLARQQGQGVLQWWENGLYENSYVKVDGIWKIEMLAYRPQGQADVALAWSHAGPDFLSPFSETYPEDPAGPDKLAVQAFLQ